MAGEPDNLNNEPNVDDELAALDAEIAAQLDAEAEGNLPSGEWYVIHSYSGMENKVKKNIEHRAESMGMSDRILRSLFQQRRKSRSATVYDARLNVECSPAMSS
ncbi:MAG: transcription termination/antitermination NusG family protein [Caldilineaceae bacterium]